MKKILTIAAAASLTALVFSPSAIAQGEMSADEHQQMMSGIATPDNRQTMSDSDMHRRMLVMMERCEESMGKKENHTSASSKDSTKKTSAEGKWAWRPDPGQAPGPRASLRPPIRVWVPTEKSSHQ